MSIDLSLVEKKLEKYCNQELFEFPKSSKSPFRRLWFILTKKTIETKKVASTQYWEEITALILPYISDPEAKLEDVTHLIRIYFTSVKFSKMRCVGFDAAEGFYKNTIHLVKELNKDKFLTTMDKGMLHQTCQESRDLILNTCYYTDWFLYKMVEAIFYPDGGFVLDTAPRSYIKNIAFQVVNDYRFGNSPFASDHTNDPRDESSKTIFIGRKSIVEKFLAFLQAGRNNRKGVYLVTGYRGMGKTSFVNRVINIYKDRVPAKSHKVIPVTISLAQRQPSEVDILHLMVSHLKDKLTDIPPLYKYPRPKVIGILQVSLGLWLLAFCSIFVINYITETRSAKHQAKTEANQIYHSQLQIKLPVDSLRAKGISNYNLVIDQPKAQLTDDISLLDVPEDLDYWLYGLLFFLFILICAFIGLKFYPDFLVDKSAEQINNLFDRCYASIIREQNDQTEISLEQLGAKFSANGNKQTATYPLASSKEIEYELIKFLNSINKRAEFIFIFDELDKIEPAAISTSYFNDSDLKNYDQGAYLEQIRERKQAIINIIAGLKNFLTTAEARFIFIAGREMFDATLADVSDRQSSVGSIFNYVFYVQSFLRESIRDEVHSKGSMGQMIEHYISKMIITKNYRDTPDNLYKMVFKQYFEKDISKLKELYGFANCYRSKLQPFFDQIGRNVTHPDFDQFIKGLQAEQKELSYQVMKAIITLQNLVNYLTYRSNGSPKKIIKTLHEFIRIKKYQKYDDGVTILSDRTSLMMIETPYIFLNLKDQYRLGFINHLFRPFIVKNGESFKKYSDNIIISTTYLFDHLLKFHPFAFSFANLELIPEVLSTNKTPSLRDHIITIIEYLSNNHLRETEIGIFDYKFYSRTVNELIYISKTFEEESAAFNFTLDEGFLVKLHVRNELKELRKVYSAFAKPKDILNSAFSITHLNGILGDLHFFDQEYDDAIVAYSNAVNELRHESERLSVTDFVVLIRFLLKLGLTFEKVKNYDEALAFYSDAAEESKNFILRRLNGTQGAGNLTLDVTLPSQVQTDQQASDRTDSSYAGLQRNNTSNSVFSDLLQIVNQAFIAKIVLQEKMGVEGITSVKFGLAIGGFVGLSRKVAKVSGSNFMITANLYLVLGNLIYFKNSYRGFNMGAIKENGEYDAFLNAYEPTELFKLFVLRDNYKHLTVDTFKDQIKDRENELLLHEKRMPVLSLWYYVIGLAEVIRSRFKERESLNFIFSDMNADMEAFRTALTEYHLQNHRKIQIPAYDKGDYDNTRHTNLINDILTYLKKDSFKRSEAFTKGHYKYVAMFTSHIGDCLLSMVHVTGPKDGVHRNYVIEEIFSKEKIENITEDNDKVDFSDFLYHTRDKDEQPTITDVIRCYYQSALFFKQRGRMVSYSFQLRKILYTLRLVLKDMHNTTLQNHQTVEKVKFRIKCLNIIETWILNPILEVAGQTTDNTDRYMFSKFEDGMEPFQLNIKDKKRKAFILNNLSSHPDSREALTLFMYIKIKTIISTSNDHYRRYEDFINPYDSYATQYTRMYELGFWSKLNLIKLRNACDHPALNHISGEKDLLPIAKEYIFALFSQIHTVEIYGVDYMISHSFKAYIHYNIAQFLTDHPLIADQAIKAVKSHFGHTIDGSLSDKYYHFKMAISHYEKTRQLHKVGAEYIKNMDNIIYLEDDINDNAYHFGAALDRFLITNGTIDSLIRDCENKIKELDDSRYTLKSYLGY